MQHGPQQNDDDLRSDEASAVSDAAPKLNGSGPFLHQLLVSLQAMRAGEFTVRMSADATGIEGKIADAFNEIVTANHRLAKEFERVGKAQPLLRRNAIADMVCAARRWRKRPKSGLHMLPSDPCLSIVPAKICQHG